MSMFTVVVPVAKPPAGNRPRVCCTTVLGRAMFAFRDAPFVAEFDPIPMLALGTERTLALTRTPTFGMVYAVSPRNDVANGSLMSHESRRWLPSTSGSAATSAHVLIAPRPVDVPPETVMPLRNRAFTLTSTPCQYCVRADA